MKKLTYVKASWCPYCKMAGRWIESFLKQPEYKDIEMEVVDIDEDPDAESKYPHQLVPNFWLGEKMIFEGVPTRPQMKEVLDRTLNS